MESVILSLYTEIILSLVKAKVETITVKIIMNNLYFLFIFNINI